MTSNSVEYHPIVFWGQTKEYTLLSVKIKSAENLKVDIGDETLKFSANGEGATGHKEYAFEITYYLPVIPKSSSWKAKDNFIEIKLKKEYKDSWPRLSASPEKIPWLKCDFNNFFFEESDYGSNESDQEFEKKREDAFTDFIDQKKLEESAKYYKKVTKPVNLYMMFYNLFQYAGYLYIFGACLFVLYKFGIEQGKQKVHLYVKDQLLVVQLISFAEIIHAALGYVKSSPYTAAMQVCGRNMVLVMVVLPHESLYASSLFFWLAIVWSSIEIIRHPYYLVMLLHEDIAFLTWLRYTAWIPLYPIGFMTEGRLILKAMPLLAESGQFSLDLPNMYNVKFNFVTFLYIYIPVSCIGFYILINRMLKQRQSKIGPTLTRNWKNYNFLTYLVETFSSKKKKLAKSKVSKAIGSSVKTERKKIK